MYLSTKLSFNNNYGQITNWLWIVKLFLKKILILIGTTMIQKLQKLILKING